MKYSVFSLGLLLSFTVYAMEENGEKKIIKTTVGQTIALPLFSRDHTNIFCSPEVKPDETILKFVKENEEKNGNRTTCKREYLALAKGTTDLKFRLHAASLGKFLGPVSFTVVVE